MEDNVKDGEEKKSRGTLMTQMVEAQINTLWEQYNKRFEKLESKLSKRIPNSGFEEFMELKDENKLFEGIDHQQRIAEAKDKDFKGKKVIENNMVLYQLYSRYKEMTNELDHYKNNLMESLKFESDPQQVLMDDQILRTRSKSVDIDLAHSKLISNPQKELEDWNMNLNDRIINMEKFCKQTVPKKFNETVRNRGILAHEIRVMDNTIGQLRSEINELKGNPGQKSNNDNMFATLGKYLQ